MSALSEADEHNLTGLKIQFDTGENLRQKLSEESVLLESKLCIITLKWINLINRSSDAVLAFE